MNDQTIFKNRLHLCTITGLVLALSSLTGFQRGTFTHWLGFGSLAQESISRWNQLPAADRTALGDSDPGTQAAAFHTGLCNAMGDPITVLIEAGPAPHAPDPSTINNIAPGRWGLRSFFNGRSTGGESGNQYCFTFSEPVSVQVHAGEHRYFQGAEHIYVTAQHGMTPVALSASLEGHTALASVSGAGTAEVHFAANGHQGAGLWWSVKTDGQPVTTVCVEYFQQGPGSDDPGLEPFVLEIEGASRCLFDDPFAALHEDNPTPGDPIADSLVFSKKITSLVPQAPGKMLVTFECVLTNHGTVTATGVNVLEDLGHYLPAGVLDSIVGIEIDPSSSAQQLPTLNASFDGSSSAWLFDGLSGELEPGQQLVFYLHLLLDAAATPNIRYANQGYVVASGSPQALLTATSDVPADGPGDTGGIAPDYTPIYLPSIHLTKRASAPVYACNLPAGEALVQLEITLANTGNVSLTNVLLEDDLSAWLGAAFKGIHTHPWIASSSATSPPPVVMSYTGSGVQTRIFDGTQGRLDPTQTITIGMVIRVDPDAVGAPPLLSNQAFGSASPLDDDGVLLPAAYAVSDLSDHGDDAWGTNALWPGDTGGHDDPTPVEVPGLVLARHIAGVLPAGTSPGRFDLIIESVVYNTGNTVLRNLLIDDPLKVGNHFGSAFVAVKAAPAIVAVGAHGTVTTADSLPSVNASWQGIGQLFTGGGVLQPGQVVVVQYRVEVNPKAQGAPASLKTAATAFAEGEASDGSFVQISDVSDSGFKADSNPGWPGDTGTSCDPTPVGNCWSLLSGGLSCNTNVQVSLDASCTAGLEAPMILEGEPEPCTDNELLPLGHYFDLMVTTQAGIPVPDADSSTANVYEIPGSWANQTLRVKVIDVVYGNSCWGYITLKDKMAPVIQCVSPVVMPCNAAPASFAAPAFHDNCDPSPTLSLIGEQVIDADICDDDTVRIQRIYRAQDNMGNASPHCTVVYALVRNAVSFPPDLSWHCEQYAQFPGIVDASPLHPAVIDSDPADLDVDASASLPPTVLAQTGSGVVNQIGGYCGYVVSHSDAVTTTCGNSFKITRTWTLIDWCTSSIVLTDSQGNDNVQFIKVEDKTPPLLSVQVDTLSANVPGQHPQYCSTQGLLPAPLWSDACNNVTIQIITPVGEAQYVNGTDGKQGGFIPAPGLGVGTHQIQYIATDACGNQTSVSVSVVVADKTTPTPSCEGITEVSLSSNGEAEVFAQSFDDGTTDNCCLDRFEVRRMDDPCQDGHDDTVFGPSVKFCCADAGQEVMIIFRAWDCAGNYNDCMVSVNVSDKLPVQALQCPASQRISCDYYLDELAAPIAAANGDASQIDALLTPLFGQPVFLDNCGYGVVPAVTIDLDQCTEGVITRKWTATDGAGNAAATCSQSIFVDHVSDWVVSFPPHLGFDCMDWLPSFGEPQIFHATCEMIAISYEDEVFNVVPDACYKIVRKYTVINWCVVGAEVDDEVIEQPESALGLPFPACDLDGDGDCDDRTFRDSWRSGPPANRPTAAQANSPLGPDTDPDSNPWDGVIYFEQIIKINDHSKPVFTVGCTDVTVFVDTSCTASVTLTKPKVKDCSTIIDVTATGDLGTGLGPFTGVQPGTYDVTFTAFDNCGNFNSCDIRVHVIDTLKPTPFCLESLAIELMVIDTPMVTVHAVDFDKGSFDNCGAPLVFSFSSDTADSTRTFFCEDLGPQPIQMWVTDVHGNQDFCTATLDVQANMGQCDDDLVASVGGSIQTPSQKAVNGVEVAISGQWSASTSTQNGQYTIDDVPAGSDITLTPLKDDDPLNGVSTFDLVLISRHILHIELLDSPFKIIAADANRSGSVTSFDLVEFRRLILTIYSKLPNNTSWRFVPSNFAFPDPTNPWATDFPEVISINDLPAGFTPADFVAIKVGDVNGSASGNNFLDIEERSFHEELELEIADAYFEAGEVVTVPVDARNFRLSGFQLTLHFDDEKLELMDLQPGAIAPANFGWHTAGRGALALSWNEHVEQDIADGQTLFGLVFRARRPGWLHGSLWLSDNPVAGEAYRRSQGNGWELLQPRLVFGSKDAESVVLHPATPNPFRERTTISFSLPSAMEVALLISDSKGRVVWQFKGFEHAGRRDFILTPADLAGNGVYFIRLETPQGICLQRMLLLE